MSIRIGAVIIEDEPFIQIDRHAVVNLHAIERVTHYGDRLYGVRLRDRTRTRSALLAKCDREEVSDHSSICGRTVCFRGAAKAGANFRDCAKAAEAG